jgi:hypothetical protein
MTKLTEQEIETIQGFQQQTQNIIMDLGKIEIQLIDLENVKSQVKEALTQVVKAQNEFFKTIEETYGKGQIDLESFTHIPSESPESNEVPVVPFTDAEIL